MRQTIGELVRYILPYANRLEISTVNDIPFMRCILGGRSKMGKVYVYILQMNEHQYAICDNDDDLLGERYLPTGSVSKPFILEKDLVNNWFNDSQGDLSGYDRVKTQLTVNDVVDYLHNILSYYSIIRFDLNKYDANIASSIGDGRIKAKNAISKIFNEKGRPSGTIRDLIDIVIKNGDKIDLSRLKNTDIQYIKTRMSDCYGIELVIRSDCIIDVIFEKRM